MKNLARLSFLLITVLYGSFYAVAKEALGRIDPVVFMFFQMLVLAPFALALILIHRKALNRAILQRGIFLGSWLCLALLTITVAVKFTTAISTAFFPSIGGIFAAVISGVIFKRRLGKAVWLSGAISLAGMLVILMTSGDGLEFRGDVIALIGAIFFTIYIFLVDHDRQQKHDALQGEQQFWLVLGIEQLTMAMWMTLIALLFGDWQQVHPIFPKDIAVLVYLGTATTFLPVVLSTFMQKYIDPLEISFISILEPIWGVVIAYIYLGETVSWSICLGGALVIGAAVVHTGGTPGVINSLRGTRLRLPILRNTSHSRIGIIGSSLLLLSAGVVLLNWLGGFPPTAWTDLYHMLPQFQTLVGQGQGIVVVILCLRAFCWLVAWGGFCALVLLSAFSTAHLFPSTGRTNLEKELVVNFQSTTVGMTPPTRLRVGTNKRTSPLVQRRLAQRARRLDI